MRFCDFLSGLPLAGKNSFIASYSQPSSAFQSLPGWDWESFSLKSDYVSPPQLVSVRGGGQESQEAAVPRKTVYSVVLRGMSCWGLSCLGATPNFLPAMRKETLPCQTSLCRHPLPFTFNFILCFLLGLSTGRGEGKLRQRALGRKCIKQETDPSGAPWMESGWNQVEGKDACGDPWLIQCKHNSQDPKCCIK